MAIGMLTSNVTHLVEEKIEEALAKQIKKRHLADMTDILCVRIDGVM